MGLFADVQHKIDALGFLHPEITSAESKEISAPVVGKEEYEWYPTTMFVAQDRQSRYQEYEEMSTYSILSSCLDIYSDDATQMNSEGNVIDIISDNEEIKEELEWLFFKRLDINSIIWNIVRKTCKYGDSFYELVLQEDRQGVLFLKPLPPKTIVRFERNGRLYGFIQMIPSGETPEFEPFELVHFTIQDDVDNFRPYGVSIMEAARRPYRQLKLMEDAMVVYRITRAPERLIFFINTGNLPTAKAEEYLNKVKMKFRKKPFVDQNGRIDYKANPLSVDENFFVPIRGGQEGTRIEQLSGAQNLSEIDDVKYFKDKIFAALKIPRPYLQDDEGGRGWNEPKSHLSQQDVRFSRTIERVQRHIVEGLNKIAIVHLLLRGYKKKNCYEFKLEMTPSSDASELIQSEIISNRLTQARDYYELGFLPKSWIAEHVLKIDSSDFKKLFKERKAEEIEDSKQEAKREKAAREIEEEGQEGEEGEFGGGFGYEEKEIDKENKLILEKNKKKNKDNNIVSGIYSRLQVEGELDGLEPRSEEQINLFESMKQAHLDKQLNNNGGN